MICPLLVAPPVTCAFLPACCWRRSNDIKYLFYAPQLRPAATQPSTSFSICSTILRGKSTNSLCATMVSSWRIEVSDATRS
jgi:hypothetical protein